MKQLEAAFNTKIFFIVFLMLIFRVCGISVVMLSAKLPKQSQDPWSMASEIFTIWLSVHSFFGQLEVRRHTLHLSHKEGNSSSEVKFFCNFLYMAAMDLSTYNAKTIYNVRMSLTKVFSEYIGTTLPRINWILTSSNRSTSDRPTWKGIWNWCRTLDNYKF